MRDQFKDKSPFDDQLRQLDKDIIWKEQRKSKLKNEILFSMNRNRSKTKLVAGLKYASSIGLMAIVLFFGYNFFSDSMTYQDEGSSTGSVDNQTKDELVIEDSDDAEEKVATEDPDETTESTMELQTGSVETATRKTEGMDHDVEVINYKIEPYGVAYQLDEALGTPEVNTNKITYSIDDEYKITLAIIEDTNLDEAVSNLQERFEAEGYEEEYELESTPSDENSFTGKMQYFGDNREAKGFIAYEVDGYVLEITFQYPIEAGDGMYSILNSLRKSIHLP